MSLWRMECSWFFLLFGMVPLLISNSPLASISLLNVVSKAICSTSFMIVAVMRIKSDKSKDNVGSFSYGRLLVIALAFSLFGDIFLTQEGEGMFIAGTICFVITHLLYTLAFAIRCWISIKKKKFHLIPLLSVAIMIMLTSYILAFKIIIPQIPTTFLSISYLYTIVISFMVAISPAGDEIQLTASSAQVKQALRNIVLGLYGIRHVPFTIHQRAWLRVIGSLLFYASDLMVARQAFIRKSFYNPLIGLPLYYVAQMIIASTI